MEPLCALQRVYGKSTTKFAQQRKVETQCGARSNGVAFAYVHHLFTSRKEGEKEREKERERNSSWRKFFQILSRESRNEITRESLSLSLSLSLLARGSRTGRLH